MVSRGSGAAVVGIWEVTSWLGTKGVTVAHTEQEVSGHFHAQHDVPQVLAIVEELCQMLEDKFGAYPYAIVS